MDDSCRQIKARHFLFFLSMLGPMQMVFAQAPIACSEEKSRLADVMLIDAREGWRTLYNHQEVFLACDDGVLAEGYSDAVVQLFSKQWKEFPLFVALSEKQQGFRDWTLRHIDASASKDDLQKIIGNTKSCNAGATLALCQAVRSAAKGALAEAALETER